MIPSVFIESALYILARLTPLQKLAQRLQLEDLKTD
jgi:hypothetical protein